MQTSNAVPEAQPQARPLQADFSVRACSSWTPLTQSGGISSYVLHPVHVYNNTTLTTTARVSRLFDRYFDVRTCVRTLVVQSPPYRRRRGRLCTSFDLRGLTPKVYDQTYKRPTGGGFEGCSALSCFGLVPLQPADLRRVHPYNSRPFGLYLIDRNPFASTSTRYVSLQGRTLTDSPAFNRPLLPHDAWAVSFAPVFAEA